MLCQNCRFVIRCLFDRVKMSNSVSATTYVTFTTPYFVVFHLYYVCYIQLMRVISLVGCVKQMINYTSVNFQYSCKFKTALYRSCLILRCHWWHMIHKQSMRNTYSKRNGYDINFTRLSNLMNVGVLLIHYRKLDRVN